MRIKSRKVFGFLVMTACVMIMFIVIAWRAPEMLANVTIVLVGGLGTALTAFVAGNCIDKNTVSKNYVPALDEKKKTDIRGKPSPMGL